MMHHINFTFICRLAMISVGKILIYHSQQKYIYFSESFLKGCFLTYFKNNGNIKSFIFIHMNNKVVINYDHTQVAPPMSVFPKLPFYSWLTVTVPRRYAWTVLISSSVKIGDVRLANYESPVPLCIQTGDTRYNNDVNTTKRRSFCQHCMWKRPSFVHTLLNKRRSFDHTLHNWLPSGNEKCKTKIWQTPSLVRGSV